MPKEQKLLSHTGIGAQTLNIDSDDFVKGMSTNDFTSDGGFSVSSKNINIHRNPGTISATDSPVSDTFAGGSSLHNQIIATCPNENIASVTLLALDQSGYFYTVSTANVWTQRGQDSTNTFSQPYTDLVYYQGKYYASSHNVSTGDNVAQIDSAYTIVPGWFHTNFSQYLTLGVPHPMLVWNDFLYIADGSYLHRFDGTTYSYKYLTLSTDAVITALSIEPGSGKIMIASTASTVGLGSPGGVPQITRFDVYGGYNPTQTIKTGYVDDISYALFPLSGQLFVGYGSNLGVWNGNGVTFLRALADNAYINKQRITNIGNDLYYVNDVKINVYSELLTKGDKVFSPIHFDSSTITSIFNEGNNRLGYSYTSTLKSFDVTAVGDTTSAGDFFSKWTNFPRPVYIRGIDVKMSSILTSGESAVFKFNDEAFSNINIGTIDNSFTLSANRLMTDANPTTSFQLEAQLNCAASFVRAIVYYDLAE